MKLRWWLGLSVTAFLLAIVAFTVTNVSADLSAPNSQTATAKLLRRCETNYDDDEIQAMRDDGEDLYEPDDCPLLAHVLTGPMALNFCQGGDEDWVKFRARGGLIYQIRAEPRWNYPTEPHLDLYDVGMNLIKQNDHYFDRNAEIWWWNNGGDQWVYVRATELRGRHDCGNDSYTLTLDAFTENPYPATPVTPIITATMTPTATVTNTPTVAITTTSILTTTIIPTDTTMVTATVTVTSTVK